RARRGCQDPCRARPDRRAEARRRSLGPTRRRGAGSEALGPLPAHRRQENGGAGRHRRRGGRDAAHQDRRVRQGRAARGGGDRRRAPAEVEEALEAHDLARPGAAHGGRRDRRALRASGDRGQEGRHRGEPRGGEADGRRVQRDGAGRFRRRQARGPHARSRSAARSPGHVSPAFGPALSPDEYVDAMVQVAERDASIGRVLREILSLDGAVRSSALDLVAAHLRVHSAAGDSTIQTLFHGLLLFVLPAYWASTTLTSRNVVFLGVLVMLTLLATFDPWYRAIVHPRPWLGYVFFVVSIFAALNVALPLVGLPPFWALMASAFVASLAITPVVRRAGGRTWV